MQGDSILDGCETANAIGGCNFNINKTISSQTTGQTHTLTFKTFNK